MGENGGVGVVLVVKVRFNEGFLRCPASPTCFEVGVSCHTRCDPSEDGVADADCVVGRPGLGFGEAKCLLQVGEANAKLMVVRCVVLMKTVEPAMRQVCFLEGEVGVVPVGSLPVRGPNECFT